MERRSATSRDSVVNTLRSWLRATGIQFEESSVPGADLTIRTVEGGELHVVVLFDGCEAPEGVLGVQARELRCSVLSQTQREAGLTRSQVSLSAFHSITTKAGYGKPIPFQRGEEPSRTFSWEEDGFLVPLRHHEFRNAPNPPAHKYQQYKVILITSARRFYRQNTKLCDQYCHSVEDLHTMAMFLLVSFCAHHEKANPAQDENEKLLTCYIKQRFEELRQSWRRHFLSRIPAGAIISLHHDYNNQERGLFGEFDSFLDSESQDQQRLITEEEEESRKRQSKRDLKRALAALPHDQMIAALQNITDNEEQSPDTRKAAQKRLHQHVANCKTCKCLQAHSLEVSEEGAAVDAGSV